MAFGLQLSDRERAYYQQLFSGYAEAPDYVGASGGFSLFSTSGVDTDTLAQIWNYADRNQNGGLDFDAFSAALRLIGYAQAGQLSSPDQQVYQEPPQLPQFPDVPLPPPDSGGGLHMPSPSFGGSPFNTYQGDAPRGRPRQRGADSPTPTSRDCRKYARLFLKLDTDGDGYISAMEAQELFTRSGIDPGVLHQIWELSDVSNDGALDWPEFVLAMHLVRRARTNVPLPQGGLPPELTNYLGSVESPHVLKDQHSPSSRAHSPGATSAGDASWGPSSRMDNNYGGDYGTNDQFNTHDQFNTGMPSFGGDFGTQGPSDQNGFGGGFDGGNNFGNNGFEQTAPAFGFEGDMGPSKKDKKRNKHDRHDHESHHERDQDFVPEVRDDPAYHLESRLGSGFDFGKPSTKRRGYDDGSSPDFGQRSRRELPAPPRHDAPPVEHFEAVVEADKVIVHSLRRDVDELDMELSRLEEACLFEERETVRERMECDMIGRERDNLRQQLAASQRQLNELKEEHEGIVLENVMLRCDHDHFAKEANFLKRLLDEATRDAQALQHSIEYLEQSNTSIRAHTKTLEDARQDVLGTVRNEKELLRKEQREVEFAKQALEALRIDGVDGLLRISGTRPSTGFRSSPAIPPDGVQRPRAAMDQLAGGGGYGSNGVSGYGSNTGNGTFSGGFSQPSPYPAPARDGMLGSRLPGPGARVPVNSSQREGV